MNAAEIGELVGLMALYDNRTSDEATIVAWLKVIGDLPYTDCESAVIAHYTDSTERIMPGHVRQRVKAMRKDRVLRTPLPAPPADLADQPGRYQQAIQAGVRRVAAGMDATSHKAIGGPLPGDPPPAWSEARKAITPPEAEPVDPQQAALKQVEASRAEREAREAAEREKAS